MAKVYVIGVGMTCFEKPGRRNDFDYPQMVKESVTKALSDANINYDSLNQAVVGYVYGESCSGQRALYEIGMTGIPIYNVQSNCSTGANALILAKQLIESGQNECVLAVGFEKMEPGSLGAKYTDRTLPMDKHIEIMSNHFDITAAPMTAQLFGNAGIEHMKKYGSKPEHFAKIAYKNHKHSVNNPYAQFQEAYTLEQIENSPKVHEFLTRLQCSPTSDGSAAVILASENFVRRNRLEHKAVEIIGMEMTTDPATTFTKNSVLSVIGFDMTKLAADRLFAKAKCTPHDVDVIELHDCFSTNELITYEALGLCPVGQGAQIVEKNDNTYGGRYVINPSGGLISKGHPLGATGLAQCAELTWQLRGEAGPRQVKNAKLALQHNIGLGGAVVVSLYRLGFPQTNSGSSSSINTSSTAKKNTTATSGNNISPNGEGFLVTPYLRILEIAMQEDKDNLIEKVRGTYGFRVTHGPNGQQGFWIINAKTGKGSVTYGGKEKPDVTFIIKDTDVVDLISGKLQPQKAFFQGKVKVQGNMGLAMKLIDLQKTAQGRIEEYKLRAKL